MFGTNSYNNEVYKYNAYTHRTFSTDTQTFRMKVYWIFDTVHMFHTVSCFEGIWNVAVHRSVHRCTVVDVSIDRIRTICHKDVCILLYTIERFQVTDTRGFWTVLFLYDIIFIYIIDIINIIEIPQLIVHTILLE